ncbi:F-box only protein 16 [Halichoeres trimaculatus]|uniref:F-box only protein 16 n=1 Tax=Halichoeres trimaculatus TaxID=147232 RepID=UPI003D9F6E3B
MWAQRASCKFLTQPRRSNTSKMPLEARASSQGNKMQTTMSTWTPLNHLPSNSKVFGERRNLLAKWFAQWSDSQRRAVLQDFVKSCSEDQLLFLSLSVSKRLPLQATDFTCLLPRALSLFLFSFLDPRSLCRCAQVSWHWRSIVELDQLWRPKCERLGWYVSFAPTPLEQGVWKRLYIHSVQELQLTLLQTTSSQEQLIHGPHAADVGCGHEELSALISDSMQPPPSSSHHRRATSRRGQPAEPPPWRDSDTCPKDTLRFNYLDNMDPTQPALSLPMRTRAFSSRTNTRKPADVSRRWISEGNYKLRKAKSLMFLCSNSRPPPPPPPPPLLHEAASRPSWAACSHDHLVSEESTKSTVHLAQWNAGIYSRPARTAVPRLSVGALRASQCSHRSSSTPLG